MYSPHWTLIREEIDVVDLGEWDARRLVPHSEEDQEAVFRGFRERLEGLTKEDWEYILESSDRQGATR